MFRTDESDLDSTESQPPSSRRPAYGAIFETFDLAQYTLQDNIDDITKEVSRPPA